MALGFTVFVVPERLQEQAEGARGDPDGVTVADLAGKDLLGQRVLQLALDDPLQGPGPIDRVVAGVGQPLLGLGTTLGLQHVILRLNTLTWHT